MSFWDTLAPQARKLIHDAVHRALLQLPPESLRVFNLLLAMEQAHGEDAVARIQEDLLAVGEFSVAVESPRDGNRPLEVRPAFWWLVFSAAESAQDQEEAEALIGLAVGGLHDTGALLVQLSPHPDQCRPTLGPQAVNRLRKLQATYQVRVQALRKATWLRRCGLPPPDCRAFSPRVEGDERPARLDHDHEYARRHRFEMDAEEQDTDVVDEWWRPAHPGIPERGFENDPIWDDIIRALEGE